MFADNDKISQTQCMRLLFFDMIGIATLVLPGFLAKICGEDGTSCIFIGMILGLLWLWTLSKALKHIGGNYLDFSKTVIGTLGEKVLGVVYGLYYLLFGAYSIYLLSQLIQETLLKEEKFWLISLSLLVLVVYGIYRGIESRARVYEILFYLILIPFLIMLLLGAGDMQLENMTLRGTTPIAGIAKGSYGVFLIFSSLQMLLMTSNYIEPAKSLKAGRKSVLLTGILLFALYEILLGVFGVGGIQHLSFPAVNLMSTVTIPGGFLRRGDSFMVAVWFFTLYAAGASGIFYGSQCLSHLWKPKGKKQQKIWHGLYLMISLALAYFISYQCMLFQSSMEQIVWKVFWYLTPFFLILPFILLLLKGKKPANKRTCSMFLVLVLAAGVLCSGCSVQELENRSFPLAVCVGEEHGQCVLEYKFQDLTSMSTKEGGNQGSEEQRIQADSFYQAVADYKAANGKVIDLNHVKVLIIEEGFLKNQELFDDFCSYLYQSDLLSGNILLFVTEDTERIGNLQEQMSEPLGTYLEELMEGNDNYRSGRLITLKSLLNNVVNRNQTIGIPWLTVAQELPVEDGYGIFSQGHYMGKLPAHISLWLGIFQKTVRETDLSIHGVQIHLEDMKTKYTYGIEENPKCTVILSAKYIPYGNHALKAEDIEGYLKQRFAREVVEYQNAEHIDLTNSFCYMTTKNPAFLKNYAGNMSEYTKEVALQLEVKIDEIKIKPADFE